MPSIQRITPCRWFDGEAEEAARFYTGIFSSSRITAVTRLGGAGSAGARRAMAAMLQMRKLDIAALRRARDGSN